jgi:hypothetical protein
MGRIVSAQSCEHIADNLLTMGYVVRDFSGLGQAVRVRIFIREFLDLSASLFAWN